MVVTLYHNSNDATVVDKNNSYLQEVGSYNNVQLKEPTSLESPVFIFPVANKLCNYIYVPDFQRYYFVDSVDILDGQRAQYKCSVDVLNTYKAGIYNNRQVVIRTAAKDSANFYLTDNSMPLSSVKSINIYELTPPEGGFQLNAEQAVNSIVLNVIKGE